MIKSLLVIIIVLILVIATLSFDLKLKLKKIKSQNDEIFYLKSENESQEIKNNFLLKELEIEKEYKKKLAEKLSIISVMPIDDVLSELQNNKDNQRGNNLHS